jgi:hypothetical protein
MTGRRPKRRCSSPPTATAWPSTGSICGAPRSPPATRTLSRSSELLADAGLRVAGNTHQGHLQPGELLCTKGLYRALKMYGPQRLSAALSHIGERLQGSGDPQQRRDLRRRAWRVRRPGEGFDPDRFGEALSASSAEEWSSHPALAGVKGGAVRADTLRKVMLEVMAMLEDDDEREEAA